MTYVKLLLQVCGCAVVICLMTLSPAFSEEDDAPDVWGFEWFDQTASDDGIIFAPIAIHTIDDEVIVRADMLGISYDSWLVGTFVNSDGEQTYFAGRSANIFSYGPAGMDLFYGAMYGYDGSLGRNTDLPDFVRPIFEQDVIPGVAISPYYKAYEHVELRMIANPFFVAMGFKFTF